MRRLITLALPILLAACGVEVERTDDTTAIVEPDDTRASESTLGTPAAGTTLVTTGNLNLRKGPGKSYAVIAVMPKGSKVIALGDPPSGAYYRVRFGSLVGFAHGAYLVRADEGDVVPPTDSGTVVPPATDSGVATDSGAPIDAGSSPGIWHPAPGTTWHWQLTGTLPSTISAKMIDIDLEGTSASTIAALRAKGHAVICYFSAGSYEKGRPDSGKFLSSDRGKVMDGWPDEQWLDIRSANVRNIMKARLDLAKSKACDGVEPDNVDGYANATGFPLTSANQIDYNRFLATESHARGLSVGLKNTGDLVPSLIKDFDWALNEECLAFSECAQERPFIDAGKAVFHVEYVGSSSEGASKQASICGSSQRKGFSTMIAKLDLGAWRLTCP